MLRLSWLRKYHFPPSNSRLCYYILHCSESNGGASLGTQTADVHLEILDGVGHWHCIEAPEEVADHLIQFVRGLKRVRTPESSVWRITDSS